jgi:hypothetical protein
MLNTMSDHLENNESKNKITDSSNMTANTSHPPSPSKPPSPRTKHISALEDKAFSQSCRYPSREIPMPQFEFGTGKSQSLPNVFLNPCQKRRITSQDWFTSKYANETSTNTGSLRLPSTFTFDDQCREDDPSTSALLSFSQSQDEDMMNVSEHFKGMMGSVDDGGKRRGSLSEKRKESHPCTTDTMNQYMPPIAVAAAACEITELDVLLGRGGLTNNHPGNIRYREEVEKTKPMYHDCTTKNQKKEVSELLQAFVHDYGGRFLEKDPDTSEWVLASAKAARKKCSQALRESKWKTSGDKKNEPPG